MAPGARLTVPPPSTNKSAPTAAPIVSTSKPAQEQIQTIGSNITNHVNSVNTQANNVKAAVAAKQAVATPVQQTAQQAQQQPQVSTTQNAQGMTPAQMSAYSNQQMEANTISQSKQQPGQVIQGGQTGALQTGTEQTPQTFQAYTSGQPNVPMTGQMGGQAQPSQGQPQTTQPSTTQPGATGAATTGASSTQGGTQQPQTPDQQLADLNSQMDQSYQEYTSKVESIQNGTFPLNPTQQATINSIMSNFSQLRSAQEQANKAYVNATNQAGITSGRSRYAPEIQSGEVLQAVSAGIAKISKIEAEASQALVQAQTAFQKEDYEQATSAYDTLQKHLSAKTDQMTKLMDLSQKAAEAAQKQQFEMMKFQKEEEHRNFTDSLASANFDAHQQETNFNQIMTLKNFDVSEKQRAITNTLNSDRLSWDMKRDMLNNALQNAQLDETTRHNLETEAAKIEELKKADTPPSRREFNLAKADGYEGSYVDFLGKKQSGATTLTYDQKAQLANAPEVKTLNSMANFKQHLQEYRSLVDKYGYETPMGEGKSQLDQAYSTLVADWKTVAGLGALSQGDYDLVDRAIKPSSGGAVGGIVNFLSGGKDTVTKSIDSAMGALDITAKRTSDQLTSRLGDQQYDPYVQSILSPFKPAKYGSIDDYVRNTPKVSIKKPDGSVGEVDPLVMIDQLGKDHPNWSDDEKLQFMQSLGDNQQRFNQSPSTDGKGSQEVGGLSAKYESSGNPGAIGYDNTGGWSYGKYQLAHNNAYSFVNESPYKSEFKGIKFNSPEFRSKWKEVAAKDPQGFEKAQHDYIVKTHLEPQEQKLASVGFDLNRHSPVLRDVVFSTAVQHGAGTDVVQNAIRKVGKNASDKDLIKAIYDERWSGGRRFARSTPDIKKSVYNRFFGQQGELNTALKQLNQYA